MHDFGNLIKKAQLVLGASIIAAFSFLGSAWSSLPKDNKLGILTSTAIFGISLLLFFVVETFVHLAEREKKSVLKFGYVAMFVILLGFATWFASWGLHDLFRHIEQAAAVQV